MFMIIFKAIFNVMVLVIGALAIVAIDVKTEKKTRELVYRLDSGN